MYGYENEEQFEEEWRTLLMKYGEMEKEKVKNS